MSIQIPNRVPSGKKTGGQFASKTHGEQEIDLPVDVLDEAPEVPQPQLTSFALTMLKVAADNYRDAGEEVPAGLAERIRQGESAQAAKEAAQQAQREASRPQPEPAPEAEPEVIHDLTTDEGRFAAADEAERKTNDLLAKSQAAESAVRNADVRIANLRAESYKGISFDVQRLREKTQPLRDAAREANEAYIQQRRVWDQARDYARENRSEEAKDKERQIRMAHTDVVVAKSELSLMIHNGASEEDKEAARNKWTAAIERFKTLKGIGA